MICILKMAGGEPAGWIIAASKEAAMARAAGADQMQLAYLLRDMPMPPPGKYEVGGYIMLVDGPLVEPLAGEPPALSAPRSK